MEHIQNMANNNHHDSVWHSYSKISFNLLLLLIVYHGLWCARFHLCTDNAGVNSTVDSLRNTAVETHEKHQREDNFMVKEGRWRFIMLDCCRIWTQTEVLLFLCCSICWYCQNAALVEGFLIFLTFCDSCHVTEAADPTFLPSASCICNNRSWWIV